MKIEGDAKLIAAAFVKARGAMKATVSKDGTGNYGNYPTLAALVEATTEHLAKNGLAIIQEPSIFESGVIIETWLVHESGATMQFTPLAMPLADRRPQAVGSAITYGRRYALAAICGLAPDDDDDGQAAQDATPTQRQGQAAKPQAAQKAQSATAPQQGAPKATMKIVGDSGPTGEGTPPHQRMWGVGMSIFGPDWDMARPWVVKKWTERHTPNSVRESSADLSDDEKDLLADSMNNMVKELQRIWPKQKAVMAKAQAEQVAA